jgi:Integrase core domain
VVCNHLLQGDCEGPTSISATAWSLSIALSSTSESLQLPSGHTNALAESVNGLYKTELINRKGPWRTRDDVELATFEWVDWYNHRRIHGSCQNMPPVEYEAAFHMKNEPANMAKA